jgi:hypothetical protein
MERRGNFHPGSGESIPRKSANLKQLWEEMSKAHQFDARRLWMLNVESIKPGEFLTQFFLDMAFDTSAFQESKSVRAYLEKWVGQL